MTSSSTSRGDEKLEENFRQLRKEFEKELDSCKEFLNEFDLRRGLQGHNNDIDYVRAHLRGHLRFLSAVDWSTFKPHPVLSKYYPWGFVGPAEEENGTNDDDDDDDDNNRRDTFAYIETVGRADPDGIMHCAPISSVILNRLYDTEFGMLKHIRKYENETGRQAKIVYIFDMEQFSLDSTWLSILGKQFKVGSKFFSDRYSEILRKVVVVNCPSYVYYVWRLVQPVLPEMTKEKVEICYGDEWREKLLQYVHPDRLPVHWGGNLKEESEDGVVDTMCRSKVVVPPGKVPKDLLWRPSSPTNNSDHPTPDQCRQLAVSAGQFEYVDVNVDDEKVGKRLKWYFTTSGDFSFGVFYRPITDGDDATDDDHNNMQMVYPFFDHLPGPTQVPEMAEIECKKAGIYRLRFGNEMGWWYKLHITYHVTCS